jgi:hypothetical protein
VSNAVSVVALCVLVGLLGCGPAFGVTLRAEMSSVVGDPRSRPRDVEVVRLLAARVAERYGLRDKGVLDMRLASGTETLLSQYRTSYVTEVGPEAVEGQRHNVWMSVVAHDDGALEVILVDFSTGSKSPFLELIARDLEESLRRTLPARQISILEERTPLTMPP